MKIDKDRLTTWQAAVSALREEERWLKRAKRVIRALLKAVPPGSGIEECLLPEIAAADKFLKQEKER